MIWAPTQEKNSIKDARKYIHLDELTLFRGGELRDVKMAFETWGTLNSKKDNAVLLFTGLSPSAHAASSPLDPSPGWWEYMLGDNKPLDSGKYFIICVNSLGSCFGSTGPASPNPKTGKPYGVDFPLLSIEDIAESAYAVIQQLGIQKLHSVIGASLGGMTSLAYALKFPQQVTNLVSISAAMSATPYAIAIRSLQRDIIRSDPEWHDGRYSFEKGPREGIRLARKLGISSYRSPTEWQQRFGRNTTNADPNNLFAPRFEIESYLDYNAKKFVDQFDANCYLYLSQAMDLFDIKEHGRNLEDAMDKIQVERSLVIGIETDFLFPIWQQAEMAKALEDAGINTKLARLNSVQGHDAFLADKEHFSPIISDFFA